MGGVTDYLTSPEGSLEWVDMAKATPTSQEEQFQKAFDEYADGLFRHAFFRLNSRDRALEITQDAFLKTWKYVQGGGEVQQFKSFLYRVLNNLIIDEYRKAKEESLDALLDEDVSETALNLATGSVRDTQESLDEDILFARVRSHLLELPDDYRKVVTLRYIDGFSPKEIAGILGVTENVISVRIHRGIIKLRELCNDIYEA